MRAFQIAGVTRVASAMVRSGGRGPWGGERHTISMQDTEAPLGAEFEETAARLPTSLKLILLAVFLPEGTSFFIAGLRLTVTRVILIVLTPIVFARLGRKISAGRYRFVASDLFVPLAAFWMFLGPAVSYDLQDSLTHSGPVVLEYLIGYMATRFLLSDNGQATAFSGFLCIVISVVCLDGILDTISGHYITREVVHQITGYDKIWHVSDESRFGLLRAAGPLEHPILLGFTAGIGFLISIAVRIKWRIFCVVGSAIGVVICFSSAPELCVILGIGLLAFDRLAARLPRRWLLIWAALAVVVAALFSVTDSPFGHLFSILTIDPQTAYFRLYIWNTVGPAILQYPFFSVLDSTYDYAGSIDSLWLVLALSYGVPCGVLTALSMFGACSLPISGPGARLTKSDSRLGAVLSILICLIALIGFTVHLWGSVWVLVGLLLGVRAHLGELGQLNWAKDSVGRGALAPASAFLFRPRLEGDAVVLPGAAATIRRR